MKVLETDRLVLREFVSEDAQFILNLLNQPSFLRYIGDKGVRTCADARAYLVEGPLASYREHGFGLWAVETREQAALAGMCGLIKRPELDDVDVGFAFLPEFWRLGYASEAGTAVLEYGFREIGLERVVAITQPDNLASRATLAKMRMRFEGMTRLAGDDIDLELWSTGG